MATQTNSSLWHIIKRHMNELENINNISFGDKSRSIFKSMEAEILQWERTLEVEMPEREEVRAWNGLTSYQRRLIDLSQNKFGTSILEYETDKLREARELETRGYIAIHRPSQYEARYVICFLTIKGRQLLNANKGVARA